MHSAAADGLANGGTEDEWGDLKGKVGGDGSGAGGGGSAAGGGMGRVAGFDFARDGPATASSLSLSPGYTRCLTTFTEMKLPLIAQNVENS